MTRILINPKRVYETGMTFSTLSERVSADKSKMENEIANELDGAWVGGDNSNFLKKLQTHADMLQEVIDFLDGKSSRLKETALNHNTSDNNFRTSIERSVDDESSRL